MLPVRLTAQVYRSCFVSPEQRPDQKNSDIFEGAATFKKLRRRIYEMSAKVFQQIVWPARQKFYRFALRMLGSEEEARDVVQDALAKTWERKEELHAIRNPEAWTMTVTRNLSLDRIKAKRNHDLPLEAGMHTPAAVPDPLRQTESKETLSTIHAHIDQLPEKQKTVMQLREVEGYSYQEIAEVLKIDLNMVKTHLYRARQSLRKSLQHVDAYGIKTN